MKFFYFNSPILKCLKFILRYKRTFPKDNGDKKRLAERTLLSLYQHVKQRPGARCQQLFFSFYNFVDASGFSDSIERDQDEQ